MFNGSITPEQFQVLMRPLNSARIAKRSQGGKELSYLESWDVRAHLIRVFGFGNFDIDLLDYAYVGQREYESSGNQPKPMIEVIWQARVQLTVRNPEGMELCRYSDAAVGSASGPASMLGEHHDNAQKTAASDALKRCCINLGTQFGLSLYNNGSTREVVRRPLIRPEGVDDEAKQPSEEQAQALANSVGAQQVTPTDEQTMEAAAETVSENLGAQEVEQRQDAYEHRTGDDQ